MKRPFSETQQPTIIITLDNLKQYATQTQTYPLSTWDVSNITSMENWNRFLRNVDWSDRRQRVGKWDVSNVRSMSFLFAGIVDFNQPIGGWDVRRVEEMDGMFLDCKSFNQPLEEWNVRNVRNTAKMFAGASSFNQPLGRWTFTQLQNMEQMFAGAISFNQPIGEWDVSTVTNAKRAFFGAISFQQSLAKWQWKQLEVADHLFSDHYEQSLHSWVLDRPSLSMVGFPPRNIFFNNPSHRPQVWPLPIHSFLAQNGLTPPPKFRLTVESTSDITTWNLLFEHKAILMVDFGMEPEEIFVNRFVDLSVEDPFLRDVPLGKTPLEFESNAFEHYQQQLTTTSTLQEGFSPARYLFGIVCAYAIYCRKEVRLDAFYGKHNPRAYCLYARFGLTTGHTHEPEYGYNLVLLQMHSKYGELHSTIDEVADVIRGKAFHVPSPHFDHDFCALTNRAKQEALRSVGAKAIASKKRSFRTTRVPSTGKGSRAQLATNLDENGMREFLHESRRKINRGEAPPELQRKTHGL